MHSEMCLLLSEKKQIGEFEITSINKVLQCERDKYRVAPKKCLLWN